MSYKRSGQIRKFQVSQLLLPCTGCSNRKSPITSQYCAIKSTRW